jgi:serine/threonine protein kinase/formylglycine-generating enzyme required for sulfatase activity/uncharacterized membrane protein
MQSLKTCPGKSAWSDYLEGNVNDEAFSTLTEHLTFCDQCVAVLDELSKSVSASGRSPFLDEENFKHLTLTLPSVCDRYEAFDLEVVKQIDNFQIVRQLGAGSFGMVYLAFDCNLQREVVIKLSRVNALESSSQINTVLVEARKSANLNHPNIVSVYHVGLWMGKPYLVQQYVSGGDLRQSLRDRKYAFHETARLIAEVAEGVAFAHSHRIVHRDLKPSNILLDQSGRALIADFGLAIHEDSQMEDIGRIAGTLPYMPPEQIRGETHRLDGRSDLWSIGVMLYRLLANELPFRASDPDKLRIEICQKLARPPRQIDSTVPSELERICLKCLSIRMTDRYNTAQDLADDLDYWLRTRNSASAPLYLDDSLRIKSQEESNNQATEPLIPKGLLAFDEKDCKFFLELLPGPKTRDGVPEQIRYWLNRTASQDRVGTFAVGLIYGPSGCGKTSFILAGLIPRLPKNVICVYCEATDRDFETTLVLAIRKRIPQIPESLDLFEVLKGLRTGQWLGKDEKLLLVLDQFEQWLHGNEVMGNSPLIEALRHCDGLRTQAIVLARDDFWMRVSRFFNELEIELAERDNFQPLYLFDVNHAKKVLVLFGVAFGKFPDAGQLNEEQERFVDEAIRLLNDRGKIICVRLVLFVETLKEKAWNVETLKQIGSIHSIGSIFLEESLNSSRANPSARFHRDAICAILRCMLPEEDTNIKARLRKRSQLALASGFDEDSKEFRLILDILEKQLRLISPSDPSETDSASKADRLYQLTHDFLVPAVRDWLFQIDSQSPKGRARSRLETLSVAFEQSNDKRFIPKFLEFLAIARYLRPSELDLASRDLYWKAATKYVSQAMLLLLTVAFVGVAWNASNYGLRKRIADTKTRYWLAVLRQGQAIPIDYLKDDVVATREALLDAESKATISEMEKANIDLGRALLGDVDGPRLERLANSVESSGFARMAMLREGFSRNKPLAISLLKDRFAVANRTDRKLRIALVLFHLSEPSPLESCLQDRSDAFEYEFAAQFISEDMDSIQDYIDFLSSRVGRHASHDSLSGIVMALAGRFDASNVDESAASDWRYLVEKLFRTSKSAPMHSAAELALRKLGLDTARLLQNEDQAPFEKDWFVAPNGLTFVRIGVGGRTLNIEIRKWENGPVINHPPLQDYWISTTEVSSKLYDSFVASDSSDPLDLPIRTDFVFDQPAECGQIVDAIAFCNWLSVKEGLTPWYVNSSEDPHQAIENKSEGLNLRISNWQIANSASGYRLPNLAEFYFAAYAERKSTLPLRQEQGFPLTADVRSMAARHAWFAENTAYDHRTELKSSGKLLPNFHGLFDLHGNAAELSIATDREIVSAEQAAFHSDTTCSLDKIVNPEIRSCFMVNRLTRVGLRLVRTR